MLHVVVGHFDELLKYWGWGEERVTAELLHPSPGHPGDLSLNHGSSGPDGTRAGLGDLS